MGRTLFIYIFRDLVRIFLLASGVMSAIMSFGGLLRPLYEFGLDVSQVAAILGWSGPAMTAYSLPIAALFATTIVYGRLSADNEITACRAAGIPLGIFGMALPALVLGTLTALISLVLLCFVVPASMLKVERIIYSNISQLVHGQIERTHQIRFDHANKPVTVFAQGSRLLPTDPSRPRDQAVQLIGPVIVTYEPTERGKPQVPADFFMARSATAIIRQDHEDDDVTMEATLDNGLKFHRTSTAGAQKSLQVSIETTRFGPIPLPSPVRENTKFMDIFRLNTVLQQPEQSRRIRTLLREFISRDQQQQYLNDLASMLNSPEQSVELGSGSEKYVLTRGSAPVEIRGNRLILGGELGGTPARLVHVRPNQAGIDVTAEEIRIKAIPDTDRRRIDLEVDMINCVVKVGGVETPQRNFSRPIIVPMPSHISALTTRPAATFLDGSLSPGDRNRLLRDLYKLNNSAQSEISARLSFAVSCLILVLVGCALGMMFRSGNFLSAFAVSVVPALLSIALIVTGQHTAENVPSPMPPNWTNSLYVGLALIWSGNVAVFGIAVVLLGRLQRQ